MDPARHLSATHGCRDAGDACVSCLAPRPMGVALSGGGTTHYLGSEPVQLPACGINPYLFGRSHSSSDAGRSVHLVSCDCTNNCRACCTLPATSGPAIKSPTTRSRLAPT